ncbi:aspartate/glutamate racemase family protein [Marivita sp. GX14005]|uniref:aspartate/glutamate racemase family protein n=1 Tax=Marivita sp. GX14005 TaxID=2942276 RepID=UPI00201A06CE|nr:aspartate/glutamate racemase family protein [Marivita sp. GX14005]MCL3883120.1 aspartate/glutamate racemase family protein [Marivita sp. GX14005]
MKILLINPNTTQALTDLLDASARSVLPHGVTLDSVTAETGVPYISTRSEAVVGGLSVLEILAEAHCAYDAAIVAAFGDPGLGAARELFDIPVVGLAEAGMLTACMLGGKFSIVTFARALGPWYRECVDWHGLSGRCAGVRMLDGAFRDISDVQGEKADLLVDLANRAVEEDDADVIVLAGAPLSGLAPLVKDRIPVPVVDCAQAAVRQATTLAALRPVGARRGSFARPAPKGSVGLSPALAARIAHEDAL